MVQDQLVLALKMETARQLDLAPSEASAVPRKALYVGSGDQMMPRRTDRIVRSVRKSGVGRRLFSTFHADTSDLDPLFKVIGLVQVRH